MVGLIQKILLDMVRDVAGEEVLIHIKQEAGVAPDKEFQINNVYDDEEWQKLFAAALKILNLTPEQADEIYASYFIKDALKRFPTWFNMSKNSYEFLLIQPTIHNCFATSVLEKKERDAINDKFVVDKLPHNPKKLITHYRSHNHHCGLYKALAKGVINHYQDKAEIAETHCLKQGDDECQIHIEWSKLGA
ncbi:MAG: hypothetical protein BGO43_00890 [Gammaproteobacteria bacterium 39-13]|nr:heme NO-binding domain-containing protein [Gammaproteobacteria bacterium]OJV86921.1 MAG: hypothetical protein BGO43_00890 [Gammaproteobacteria bacterium 39-13]